MPTVETARLILRPVEEGDAGAFQQAVYGDPDVLEFMPGSGIPRSLHQTQNVVDYFIDHWERFGYGVWAVIEQATGDLIGQCGLNFVPDLQETEVLYALAKSVWGQGYATEAAHAAIHYGFDKLPLDKLIALVAHGNTGSIRVLEKLGMTYHKDVKLFRMNLKLYQIRRPDYKAGDAPYRVA
jgi:ribosomal-protein-alanine N-acetyltransferase